MGWKQRGRHYYWYRSERHGGSVRSVYVGRGPIAVLQAQCLQRLRERHRQVQKHEAAERDRIRAATVPYWRSSTALARAALIACGYYQHARRWRRRMITRQLPESTIDISRTDFDELVRLANGGDSRALRRLQQALDENPMIWRQVGNTARHAEWTVIQALSDGDVLARECILRANKALRADLAGKKPTPLRQLVVGQIVQANLELDYWRMKVAAAKTPTASRAAAHHAGAAQQRLHRALKMLELVERTEALARKTRETKSESNEDARERFRCDTPRCPEVPASVPSSVSNRLSHVFEHRPALQT